MLKVLFAEDELLTADLLEDFLSASGYEVCGIARTVDEGVALAELHSPDLAILDVRLARGNRPQVHADAVGLQRFGWSLTVHGHQA